MFPEVYFVGYEFVCVVFCSKTDGVPDAGYDVFYCRAGEGIFGFLICGRRQRGFLGEWRGRREGAVEFFPGEDFGDVVIVLYFMISKELLTKMKGVVL
jgi:hypothetical protein